MNTLNMWPPRAIAFRVEGVDTRKCGRDLNILVDEMLSSFSVTSNCEIEGIDESFPAGDESYYTAVVESSPFLYFLAAMSGDRSPSPLCHK